MIVFGGNQCTQYLYEDMLSKDPKWYKLNYFSTIMLGDLLDRCLYPPIESLEALYTHTIDNFTFGRIFCQYIMEQDAPFVEFMKILVAESCSNNVFVYYDDSHPLIIELIECIITLIRERYGKICSIINDPSDIRWLEESYMNELGVQYFINDRERYRMILSAGGR